MTAIQNNTEQLTEAAATLATQMYELQSVQNKGQTCLLAANSKAAILGFLGQIKSVSH